MSIIDMIKKIIENDIINFEKIGINNNWAINKNNIHNYLIEPRLEEYIDLFNNKIMFWTVFEEDNGGYKIVYSEEDNEFGLAMVSNKNEKTFIGFYGSFGETLYSM
jgi:hypothetical protein